MSEQRMVQLMTRSRLPEKLLERKVSPGQFTHLWTQAMESELLPQDYPRILDILMNTCRGRARHTASARLSLQEWENGFARAVPFMSVRDVIWSMELFLGYPFSPSDTAFKAIENYIVDNKHRLDTKDAVFMMRAMAILAWVPSRDAHNALNDAVLDGLPTMDFYQKAAAYNASATYEVLSNTIFAPSRAVARALRDTFTNAAKQRGGQHLLSRAISAAIWFEHPSIKGRDFPVLQDTASQYEEDIGNLVTQFPKGSIEPFDRRLTRLGKNSDRAYRFRGLTAHLEIDGVWHFITTSDPDIHFYDGKTILNAVAAKKAYPRRVFFHVPFPEFPEGTQPDTIVPYLHGLFKISAKRDNILDQPPLVLHRQGHIVKAVSIHKKSPYRRPRSGDTLPAPHVQA